MDRLVTGLFEDEQRAQSAVRQLLDHGVHKDVVGVLLHGNGIEHQDVQEPGTNAGKRMVQGGAIGAGVAALLGGAVLGPLGLIGVGPLAAALFGLAGGAVYGTVAGALTGRDTDKEEIRELAREVEEGRVLVTAVVESRTSREELEELLRNHGALQVQTI